MSAETPNAKYDHVYAVIRLDEAVTPGAIPDRNLIMVKKVVFSQEVAEREVCRLNRLNSSKGCQYFYQITRLERESNGGDKPVVSTDE
jgi:hypothetical protein